MSLWEAKGFWMRDNIHWPRPVHPLFVSFGLIPVEIGSASAYEEWSMPVRYPRFSRSCRRPRANYSYG